MSPNKLPVASNNFVVACRPGSSIYHILYGTTDNTLCDAICGVHHEQIRHQHNIDKAAEFLSGGSLASAYNPTDESNSNKPTIFYLRSQGTGCIVLHCSTANGKWEEAQKLTLSPRRSVFGTPETKLAAVASGDAIFLYYVDTGGEIMEARSPSKDIENWENTHIKIGDDPLRALSNGPLAVCSGSSSILLAYTDEDSVVRVVLKQSGIWRSRDDISDLQDIKKDSPLAVAVQQNEEPCLFRMFYLNTNHSISQLLLGAREDEWAYGPSFGEVGEQSSLAAITVESGIMVFSNDKEGFLQIQIAPDTSDEV